MVHYDIVIDMFILESFFSSGVPERNAAFFILLRDMRLDPRT